MSSMLLGIVEREFGMRDKVGGFCVGYEIEEDGPVLPTLRRCTVERINDRMFVEVVYDDAGVVADYRYFTLGMEFFYHLLPAAIELRERLEAIRQHRGSLLAEVDAMIAKLQLTIDLERGIDPTKDKESVDGSNED